MADRLRALAFRRRAAALRIQAIEAGRRARRQLLILFPLLICTFVAYAFRVQLFGADKPVRLATAVALIVIGWAVASSLGRAFQPRMARRLEPDAAGIVGFLVRLAAMAVIVLISLRIAGLQLGALALGASFTAVVVGLAAQQTSATFWPALSWSPHTCSRSATASGSAALAWTSREPSPRMACSI